MLASKLNAIVMVTLQRLHGHSVGRRRIQIQPDVLCVLSKLYNSVFRRPIMHSALVIWRICKQARSTHHYHDLRICVFSEACRPMRPASQWGVWVHMMAYYHRESKEKSVPPRDVPQIQLFHLQKRFDWSAHHEVHYIACCSRQEGHFFQCQVRRRKKWTECELHKPSSMLYPVGLSWCINRVP